jgi:hypothetical protein
MVLFLVGFVVGGFFSGLGSHRLANGCIVGSEDLDGLGSEAIQTTDIRSIHHDLLSIVVLTPNELAGSDVVELGWNGHDGIDYVGVGGMSRDGSVSQHSEVFDQGIFSMTSMIQIGTEKPTSRDSLLESFIVHQERLHISLLDGE